MFATEPLRNLHIWVGRKESFPIFLKRKGDNTGISCCLVLFAGFFFLLQKKSSFNFKEEGNEATTGIYNKETDGWTGHLSAEIIHGEEKKQQRTNNSYVYVCVF